MAELTGQQFGNYLLNRRLGEGGFAEVYQAEHVYLKTQAAIKILHAQLAQDDLQDFLSEAQTIARLRHPHIVQVLDFGVQDGVPYLVMDYAPNGTLRQRHPRRIPLAPTTILPYVKQVADALQYAHDQKLIHRDVKPENMLLGRSHEVLLSDFGIATVAQTTSNQRTQGFAGTAAYAAPEQLSGKPTQASDQYALAVVIYEWLTGDTPFHGAPLEMASQHVLVPPPSLREKMPGISPDVDQVVLIALSKNPRDRFGSVRAFATAFEGASGIPPEVLPHYDQIVAPETPTVRTPGGPAQTASSVYFTPTHHTPPAPSGPAAALPPVSAAHTPSGDANQPTAAQDAPAPTLFGGTPPSFNPIQTPPGQTLTPPPSGHAGWPRPIETAPGYSIQAPPARPQRGKLAVALAAVLIVVLLVGTYVVVRGLPGSGPGGTGSTGQQTRTPLSGGTGQQTRTTLPGGTLCLGTDFPTTGVDGSAGQPAEHGADLAVSQNRDLGSGYTLEARNFNDVSPQTGTHDPATGAQNVQQMLGTSCILAMVGPFNSGVAAAEMPIAANGGLALISPSNTNPGLTLQQYAAQYGIDYAALHPAGKPNVYFRLPGNDVVQGQVDADLTYSAMPDGLGAHTVYVIDDQEPYGVGLANFFSQDFQGKGGTILGRDAITFSGASQLPALAAKIAAVHPDAVFYGGVTSSGVGTLKAQLVQAGYTGHLVGGDGIAEDSAFLAQAGSAANGTYGTVAAPDISAFTSGAPAQFVSDYRAAFGADPGPYTVLAYDAARIIIQAIKALIQAGTAPTRDAVRAAIQNIQYDGITGHISFDQNGDNAGNRAFSIYAVQGGQWIFVRQVGV